MPPSPPDLFDPREQSDDVALHAAKSVLRRAVRLARDLRDPAVRQADDATRTEVLIGWLAERPGVVAAYVSAGSEPSTLQLLGWLAATDRRVLLPVLTDGARFLPEPAWAAYAGPDRLRPGRAGILEPTGPARGPEALAEAALILCPGLAADRAGRRLGRGGGWYDRALASAAPGAFVAVLLNDDEVLDAIPVQGWDRSVDSLITPSGQLATAPSAAGDPDPYGENR